MSVDADSAKSIWVIYRSMQERRNKIIATDDVSLVEALNKSKNR